MLPLWPQRQRIWWMRHIFSGWGWMGGRDVVDFWRDLRFWGGVFGGLECTMWVVDWSIVGGVVDEEEEVEEVKGMGLID